MRHPAVEVLLQFSGDTLSLSLLRLNVSQKEFADRIEWQSFNLLCKCTLLQFSGDHLVVIFAPVEYFAMEFPDRIEWQSFNLL